MRSALLLCFVLAVLANAPKPCPPSSGSSTTQPCPPGPPPTTSTSPSPSPPSPSSTTPTNSPTTGGTTPPTSGPTSTPPTSGPTSGPTSTPPTSGPTSNNPPTTTSPPTSGPTPSGPTSTPPTSGPTPTPPTSGPTSTPPTSGPTSTPPTSVPTPSPTSTQPTSQAPSSQSPTSNTNAGGSTQPNPTTSTAGSNIEQFFQGVIVGYVEQQYNLNLTCVWDDLQAFGGDIESAFSAAEGGNWDGFLDDLGSSLTELYNAITSCQPSEPWWDKIFQALENAIAVWFPEAEVAEDVIKLLVNGIDVTTDAMGAYQAWEAGNYESAGENVGRIIGIIAGDGLTKEGKPLLRLELGKQGQQHPQRLDVRLARIN